MPTCTRMYPIRALFGHLSWLIFPLFLKASYSRPQLLALFCRHVSSSLLHCLHSKRVISHSLIIAPGLAMATIITSRQRRISNGNAQFWLVFLLDRALHDSVAWLLALLPQFINVHIFYHHYDEPVIEQSVAGRASNAKAQHEPSLLTRCAIIARILAMPSLDAVSAFVCLPPLYSRRVGQFQCHSAFIFLGSRPCSC